MMKAYHPPQDFKHSGMHVFFPEIQLQLPLLCLDSISIALPEWTNCNAQCTKLHWGGLSNGYLFNRLHPAHKPLFVQQEGLDLASFIKMYANNISSIKMCSQFKLLNLSLSLSNSLFLSWSFFTSLCAPSLTPNQSPPTTNQPPPHTHTHTQGHSALPLRPVPLRVCSLEHICNTPGRLPDTTGLPQSVQSQAGAWSSWTCPHPFILLSTKPPVSVCVCVYVCVCV